MDGWLASTQQRRLLPGPDWLLLFGCWIWGENQGKDSLWTHGLAESLPDLGNKLRTMVRHNICRGPMQMKHLMHCDQQFQGLRVPWAEQQNVQLLRIGQLLSE